MMDKKKNIPGFLMCAGTLCVMLYLGGCSREEELIFFSDEAAIGEISDTTEQNAAEEAAAGSEEMAVVYICGAVKKPGVYELQPGSRMNDAVLAAGGFTEEAAVTSVNLAAKIADEDMIYVCTKEEIQEQEAVAAMSSENSGAQININTADIYTLCRLPGIGESKARDIVTYREKNGAFQKKEDIMQVTGIKESLYQKICDLISVK